MNQTAYLHAGRMTFFKRRSHASLKKTAKRFLTFVRSAVLLKIQERGLLRHPLDVSSRVSLARTYRKIGKPHHAALQSSIAVELNPNDFESRLEAFTNFTLLGDIESAMEQAAAISDGAPGKAPHKESFFLMAKLLLANFNKANPAKFLNIGGGPDFIYPFWRNLESVGGPSNPEPFKLFAECTFPEKDESMQIVYSSHCLEHLDDETVDRILSQARRVLKRTGSLVIKIPDFDKALAALEKSDSAFFDDTYWNYSSVMPTWPHRGVKDTLFTRAAMIFCGFWNEEYGDSNAHFANTKQLSGKAYHGPPVLRESEFKNLFASSKNPHEIASRLRQNVIETETSFSFNHQNGWGTIEMNDLLLRHGFRLISSDKEKISKRYSFIPGIRQLYEPSAYFLALPA